MTFYTSQSVFDRLAAAETQSSSRKKALGQMGRSTHSATSGRTYGSQYTSRSAQTTPRSGTASSSLFNRLANTETYATASMKGKIPSPPLDRRRSSNGNGNGNSNGKKTQRSPDSFWHRMAYTDTFSTAQHKGKNNKDVETQNPKRKTSNSFFHRMAYSETFATASKKGLVDEKTPQTTPSKKVTNSSFFDRMSKTDTYATASMKSTYDYGKSPDTPSRKIYASADLFDRLARSDTKSFSLKKTSSWKKREENSGSSRALGPRTKRNAIFQRYYSKPNPTASQTPDNKSVRSAASFRSIRSVRSETSLTNRSIKSSVVDYTSHRKPTTSFLQKNIKNININKSAQAKAKATSPLKSPRDTVPTRTTRQAQVQPQARGQGYGQRSTATRTTAAERLRQASTKQMKEKRKADSPIRSSTRTTTTSSLSSFSSSKRESSISSRSIQKAKPTPPPPPLPKIAPRPILQFDSEDDLSFGDDSEDGEEFDLGLKEGDKVDLAAPAAPAPQDDLTKASDSHGVSINAEEVEKLENGEKGDDQEIEVVLNKEKNVNAESSDTYEDNIQDSHDFEEALSIETASIDDILGASEEMADNDAGSSSSMNGVDRINENELDDEERPVKDEVNDEEELNNEPEDIIEATSYGHSEESEVDEIEQSDERPEVNDDNMMNIDQDEDDKQIDDILGKSQESEELDDILGGPQESEVLDDILDGPTNSKEEEEPEESPIIAPTTLNESDDDISMGDDESFDDEEEEIPPPQNNDAELEPQQESQEEQLENDIPQNADLASPKDDMKKANTLDSLDFILDASSTIAEEPEMGDDGIYDDESIIEEGSEFDDESFDDGSIIEEGSEKEGESDYDGEPEMEEEDEEPLPPLKYKLLISDKYHPEYGLEELYPDDVYLTDSLAAFEEGAISNEELAVLIIEALFERDFENGEHWEIDDGTARDLEDDEGGGGELEGCAFVVKRQARLDWNDLYSVAAAKGTIIISKEKDEIKVENYSYFVAG